MADYPISNVARRIVYTGSAGVGPYAFPFEVLTNTDINVYKNDTLLTLTTNYTVTISPTLGTGSITLVVAATGSDRITIIGARAVQRTTDFTTGGDFFANTLNDEMDSQTILTQQVAETAERSIKAPVTDPTSINMTLPNNTDRAGKYLSFNAATGNPEVVNTVADVTTVATNIANVNTVGTNIASVNTAATNIAAIIAAPTQATNAANSASSASTSATNAANSYDAFDDRYLGSKTSAPSVDNDGNSLLTGALYWNSSLNALYIWTGSAWNPAAFDTTGVGVTLTGTQTLTNKTLTSPVMIGTLVEDVYTITDGAGFAIDPDNGSIQTITLGASRTPTVANFAAGEAVTLMINDGTAYTITWTTIGVVWVGGTAPTLATTGFTVIELWRVGSTYYGALVGNVA